MNICGIKISHSKEPTSHLIFVKDGITFYRANIIENYNLKGILNIHGKILGQEVNFEKFGSIFNYNLLHIHKKVIEESFTFKRRSP